MMDTADSVQVFSDKYLENISDAFKTLYNEEQLSDVTIYCKEGSLKAHKLILAASSPYFCKIFRENRNDFPILILHGTSFKLMKNLIDLLYSGITDVKNNDLEALYTLIRDFEIKGVNLGPTSLSNNVRLEMNSSNVSPEGSHNRDTRFKGQKRVAVDYVHDGNYQTHIPSISKDEYNELHLPKRANLENNHMEEPLYVKREITSPVPTECSMLSSSDITSISERSLHIVHTEKKLTAWAKKQRKFKCDLCSSSFKRASHLSRHQLIHTGERPYSCDRCDKAYSRLDKLKNHVKKTHEYIPDSMYERIDNDPIDSEAEITNMNYESPNHISLENGLEIEPSSESTPKSSPPLYTISHITSILEDSFVKPPKKGRGRPRKYPPNRNFRKRKSWIDKFVEENHDNTTSRRLRERKNTKDNELNCQICDESFTCPSSLQSHLEKLHGIIDNSKESGSDNAQKTDIENTSPLDFEKANETLITISNVCSLNDANQEIVEGAESTENLTYEQLRQLLPEECTLQPITAVDVTVPKENEVDRNKTENKQIRHSDAAKMPQDMFVIDSSLEADTLNPIQIEGEISITVEETHEPKVSKNRKYKKRKRRFTVFPKTKRRKPTNAQQEVQNQPQTNLTDTASNILLDQPPLPGIEDSIRIETPTSSFKVPQLSSAIEISIVSPKEAVVPTMIPEKKQVGEEVSITVIDSSDESIHQNEMSGRKSEQYSSPTDCNLGYKSAIMLKQKPLILGGNPESRSVDIMTQPNSNISQNTLTQDLPLPITQKEIIFPLKRKRGRPKKQTKIPGEKVDEEVSITVIDTSDERIQQDEMSMMTSKQYYLPTSNLNEMHSDCKLDFKTGIILKQKPIIEGGCPESSTANIMPQLNSNISQNNSLAQDPQLPITQNEIIFPIKKKRGRPKKRTKIRVIPQVKRGRGRPRTNVYPGRPGIQNYNITNLPYGDLSYLTSQASTREEEEEDEAALMEPLVEINMDQCEQSVDTETNQNERTSVEEDNNAESSTATDPIMPDSQVEELNVKKECHKNEDIRHEEIDISEIETKIGLIGECTISVAN